MCAKKILGHGKAGACIILYNLYEIQQSTNEHFVIT